jgi:hypothetical protein
MEEAQEKMRLTQQFNLMLQRERLDLNQIRIDQRRQMLEIEADYGQEEKETTPGIVPDPAEGDPMADYNFEEDPIGSGMKFIDRLSTRISHNAPQTPTNNPMIDATKPLTDEQIDEQAKLTAPEALKSIKLAIGTPHEPKVIEVLKKQYPGITEENITHILKRLKEKD